MGAITTMAAQLKLISIPFSAALLVTTLAGCAGQANAPALSMFSGDDVVSFKVEGMACRNCAREIAHELEEVPGVRAALIDFDSATAKVAVDPDPAKAPAMDALHAAVDRWRREHFGLDDDPDCLDPARRAQIKRETSNR